MKKGNKSILILFIPLIILMIISFLNMQNSSLLSSIYKYNLKKQIIWYILGFLFLFIVQNLNLKKLLKYSFWYYLFSVLLLFLVLIFGKTINGAKAWFSFGPISFQPSELTKITLTLFLADIINNAKLKSIWDELKLIIKVFFVTLLPSILVFLEPDTGAILFFLIIALSSLFISGIKKWWFLLLALCIFLVLGLFIILYIYNPDFLINIIGTSFFYRVERLITFQTESSYQLENALTVMGAASLFGTGLNKISLYIPEAPTDFIFAFNIGNFGIISGFIVLFCYFLIDLFLINEYTKITNKKIKLFLISFISIFFFQQVVNIGMNLGLVPIIGIPLPFLSYGGSTIIVYFLFLGMILNFQKNNDPSII